MAKELKAGETLAEFLNGFAGPVKIGTENGTSFVYAGPWPEMDADKVDAEILAHWEKIKQSRRAFMTAARKNPPTVAGYFDRIIAEAEENDADRLPAFSVSDFLANVEDYARKTAKAYASYKESLRELAGAKPIKERRVLDCYESTVDDNMLIVIVEGCETLDIWDESEQRQKVKPKRGHK